jgi:hypothetical protein
MLRDQVMQERSLDLFYDTALNPFQVALFDGDPDAGGEELSGNGYARASVDTGDWSPAADGVKESDPIAFADATGAWETATHVGLYDATEAAWADVVPLVEPLDVTSAGDGPVVTLAIFYNDND